jgi:hypothetical protein
MVRGDTNHGDEPRHLSKPKGTKSLFVGTVPQAIDNLPSEM